ncbi:ABC-2 type transporter [uncultured Paludibacter sp.]|uniref:ABC-2 type transporter n=1 Tax=uncultured Paludibacter sp. TaxID=497635 RepID=A0A653AJF3_9BACT|nr:ABC-2 type transporter [uncultured Paludibacter sp.]
MKTLLFVLRKEFLLIFRDKMIVPMMLMMPTIQLILLPFAIDLDVRHLKIAVVDNDHSSYSQRLISKISSSDLFSIYDVVNSYKDALVDVGKNKADIIIQIPQGFERNLVRDDGSQIAIAADAINIIKSGLGTAYLNSIIQNFNQQIRLEWNSGQEIVAPVDVKYSFWYNPFLKYRNYMVPAILVLLITTLSGFITALNIVREKEEGTMEQINVTPLKRWQFILGKLIPFLLIGIFVLSLGLLIMRFVYGIHIEGNISTLYLFGIVYITAILGVGLLISTFANTQQQSMFIAFFFVMIFILLSGLFTNVESMPKWAYFISDILPVTHFMHAMRAIVIKGSVFLDIWKDMIYIVAFSIIINTMAILNYKKTN